MIKFGTSGWRGLIAEDFTFENLRLASLGVADHLLSKGIGKGIVVGYDARFLSERFAEEVVYVMASKGIKTYLTKTDTPTPVISACIIQERLDGAVNITASHNPYNYNGFKFSPKWGGPALPEDTKAIEKIANNINYEYKNNYKSLEAVIKAKLCKIIDPKPKYFKLIGKNVHLKGLGRSKIKVFFDPIFGTGRGYIENICDKHGIHVEAINEKKDPYFANGSPDPSDERLTRLKVLVSRAKGLAVGVATDGDADRFGIIGSDGKFIEPNKVIALLADHLARTRRYRKGMGLARSSATGSLIDLVARKYGLKLYENPVGFKYIGKLISEKKIILGGEESAGLSIMDHVPEKDGILACLLVIEAMAKEKATTSELLEDLYKRVGRLETKRENYHLPSEIKMGLARKLSLIHGSFLGRQIETINKIDGTKVYFRDGSWVLFRESGTEPMVRVYGEACDQDELTDIMDKAKGFLFKN